MAHRRELGGRKLVLGGLVIATVTILAVGSIYVTNQVTRLRLEIARLENQREFLEAGSAELLSTWNRVSAPGVVIARAEKELGLMVPAEPGLVLVQLPEDSDKVSVWRRMLGTIGGGDPVQAGEMAPEWAMGAMVSLTPRSAVGARTSR